MNKELRPSRAIRPARPAQSIATGRVVETSATCRRVLLVDLNNFACFPTLAVGLLVAALRNKGHSVNVLCPLAYDAPATSREERETWVNHLQRRIHLTDWQPALGARDLLRSLRLRAIERPHPIVVREVEKALQKKPEILLLSAYLQHAETVRKIASLARKHKVPVLLGGPMFNVADVAREWSSMPGVSAVVGAESDTIVSDIVSAVCDGEDLGSIPGLTLPDGSSTGPSRPLRKLDKTPIPDFSDFPWDKYPARIVPIMTGRGCQWDKCRFCSDVISVSGRTFRTRSVEHVLLEIQEQARRHNTRNFLFLDLKLNSYPDMLRGLADGIGRYVRNAEWIGTVHVDQRRDNGLSRRDLFAAARGGMRRVSFGLESGSQRLLDAMNKGSSVEANAEFIRNAHDAGLSIRCTMFKGFPGETAEDMEKTARFLEDNAAYIDRIRFNDFSIPHDTPIYNELLAGNRGYEGIDVSNVNDRRGRIEYRNHALSDPTYRRAKARALSVVYQINKRALRPSARQFDGLM